MSTGSLWVLNVKVMHWPWSKSLRFFSSITTRLIKPDFIWSLIAMWERKLAQMVQVIRPRWPPWPYMVKTFKNLLLWNRKADETLKFGMQHRVLECYQVCSNDAPWLTLTYFTTRSNLVPYAFVWEKVKTMDFSESIVVYDTKVGRCSKLYEYMKLWVPKVRFMNWPCSKSLRLIFLNFFSSITTDLNISSGERYRANGPLVISNVCRYRSPY